MLNLLEMGFLVFKLKETIACFDNAKCKFQTMLQSSKFIIVCAFSFKSFFLLLPKWF